MPKRKMTLDPELAAEAKGIVALAFRNGPSRIFTQEKECPYCAGKVEYSHITQNEMKNIMKRAVDAVYKLLWLKQNDPDKYEATIEYGNRHTRFWNEPRADVGWFWGFDGSLRVAGGSRTRSLSGHKGSPHL